MIWIACLLICVLNIESIFKDDYDDGSLEIFVIHNENLEIDILAKIFSHWLLSNFPVVLIAPFLSLLLGSIAAALTISLKKNKILTSIIILPFYIPILIFGTGAVNNSFFNIDYFSELMLMGIIFFIFLLVTPIACSKALRISLD